jgi:hypothetical protein
VRVAQSAPPRSGPAPLTRWPILVALVACLAAAGLSFLVEPFALLPDPWAWVVWGRELLHVDLDTTSGPSWKPLPVAIVGLLSLAQGAAPVLWVLVARAGALLAFVMAWRVARRLAGPVAGWIAVAALAVSLLPSWMTIVAMGREEGLLCALVLWAVDRHLERHEGQALALAFATALLRPEAWPFFGLYGLWVLWRFPRHRALVVALFLVLLPAWFLPDVLTTGDALQSSQKAQGGISGTTLGEPLKRYAELVPLALQLAALAGVVIAVARLRAMGLRAALAARGGRGAERGLEAPGEREPDAPGEREPDAAGERGLVPSGERELSVIALFAGALAWIALVAVTSKVANYAGIARFQHPAAAVLCVLAAVGAVWLAALLADALARRRPMSVTGPIAAAVVGVLLALAALPSVPTRARRANRAVDATRARSNLDGTLGDAVSVAGGRTRVLACGMAYTIPGNEPALAWFLDRHIEQVLSDKPRVPGVVFRVDARRRVTLVRRLGIKLSRVRARAYDPVATAGVWQILAACRPGATLDRPQA